MRDAVRRRLPLDTIRLIAATDTATVFTGEVALTDLVEP
jgi:hypothetical protein